MTSPDEPKALTLEGTLRSFLVPEAIARLDVPGGGEVKIVGALAGLAPGERVRATGEWERHKKYGPQFRASVVVPILPATSDGVRRYLGSGRVPGIGEEMARRIVSTLGARALEVIEKEPERLAEVPGIGKKRAAAIRESLSRGRSVREVMVFLQGLGISAAFAARIHKRHGDQTIQLVRQNPYRLAREVAGVGFIKADEIARSLGFAREAPERIEAGVLHVLFGGAEDGQVFTPKDELARAAGEALGADLAVTEQAIARLALSGDVIVEQDGVFLPELFSDETELAKRLRVLAAAGRAGKTPKATQEDLARLSESQRRAVEMACKAPVSVVTGGPGTGKTTITRAIVAACQAAGLRVELAAPTGRAAKRLAEATSQKARTIHRLLEWDGRSGFLRGPGAQLSADVIIIDEASMLDVSLARALVAAVPVGAGLIFVGDVDQLPSVGPGQVLRDLIASNAIPVARLTEIFRQAQSSRIIVGAHDINSGRVPQGPADPAAESDFYFLRADEPGRVKDVIVRLVCERIPARFGLDPLRDVQVLSPMRRGELGTHELSRVLGAAQNPRGRGLLVMGRTFREGDKVIQTRNDYDRDIYNGDVGIITSVELDKSALVVDIDGRPVRYEPDDLGDLELAYALTVHRAQGSEYPAVVMPVVTQHFVMLARNLLYTAVTRARKLCVLVGSPRALGIAVRNVDTRMRRTRLQERLLAAGA
jgi:exodeoxyribonuclease V alpha subunit